MSIRSHFCIPPHGLYKPKVLKKADELLDSLAHFLHPFFTGLNSGINHDDLCLFADWFFAFPGKHLSFINMSAAPVHFPYDEVITASAYYREYFYKRPEHIHIPGYQKLITGK